MLVPVGRLQYSRSSAASLAPAVPRLTAIIGSVPTSWHQAMNSSVPNWFVSIDRHAKSGRRGR